MISGTNQHTKRTWIFDPYPKINLILAGIILGILVYSGIFSARKDHYPIPSFYEKATGNTSPSHGLSKSFSEMVRLRLRSAREYNREGPLIFSFFMIQMVMRMMAIGIVALRRSWQRQVILIDVSLSILLFLFCFRHYIGVFFRMLFE
jgi:hypothetical protein